MPVGHSDMYLIRIVERFKSFQYMSLMKKEEMVIWLDRSVWWFKAFIIHD
jgi:hypothetical protein